MSGLPEGLCEGVAGDGREHVCDHGSGHHGGEGVCGAEAGRDDSLSGEFGLMLSVKIWIYTSAAE